MHLEIRIISMLQELFESVGENKSLARMPWMGFWEFSVALGKSKLPSRRCSFLCLHASNLMPCPALVTHLVDTVFRCDRAVDMCHCCLQQWKDVDLVILCNSVLLARKYKFCPLLSQLFCLVLLYGCLEKLYFTPYHLCNFLQFLC